MTSCLCDHDIPEINPPLQLVSNLAQEFFAGFDVVFGFDAFGFDAVDDAKNAAAVVDLVCDDSRRTHPACRRLNALEP